MIMVFCHIMRNLDNEKAPIIWYDKLVESQSYRTKEVPLFQIVCALNFPQHHGFRFS